MILEKFSAGLRNAITSIRKAIVIDKKVIKAYVRELQKTLIAADVNVNLVLELSKRIEERSLLEKPPAGLTRRENVIKITYEELVNLLSGEEKKPINDGDKILLVGTQGSGKTTTAAKLAYWLKKKGFSPKLICADTFRPGAYEQLKQLAEEIDVPFYGNPAEKDSKKIIKEGLEKFKSGIRIIDSEGRHKLDLELMEAIKDIYESIKPEKVFLVLDATMGQTAGEQAKAFAEKCRIDGVILTKMDGSAKGGGAISACAAIGASVYFLGVGEKIQDFEEFDAERFISRLIGFGDLHSLLERAKEIEIDEKAMKRLMSGKFTLVDIYQQIEQVQKMGSLKKLFEMLPFGYKVPKDLLSLQEEKMKKWKVIMDSMTKEERENPEIIKGSRITRIARGSGTSESEVRELLSYYKKMKKFMKTFGDERKLKKIMRSLQGGFR
ncbi:MAG TPA: signal recognition particle protein [Candidatus Altiarchaeales archaeon]|nr:signal recognition particle protein [Candidatus Altiarchaeales archaeon]